MHKPSPLHHAHRAFLGREPRSCATPRSIAGWPKDVQDAVDAAARDATAYQRQLAAAEDAEIMKKLDPAQNEVIEL